MSTISLVRAECVAAMRKLPARSVDHTITDPPYSERTHSKGRRIVKPVTVADHVIAMLGARTWDAGCAGQRKDRRLLGGSWVDGSD